MKARVKSTGVLVDVTPQLNINSQHNNDYSNDKCYYICRWLNHSFMPFTKKQEERYKQVREIYDKLHNK